MRVITLAVLFQSLVVTSVSCNPSDVPFRILLGVRSIEAPQANGDIVNFRVVVAGCGAKQTTVVTKFGQVPPILSEDGTKLTFLFTKCDGSLIHNGVNLRVDTPIADLALANVNDKTVAYLNDGIEIPIDLARMPKLRTIEVKYFVGAGTAQSPYWRGEIVTIFEVMKDKRGWFVFGDGKSLGTCEGKVTASVPPKEAETPPSQRLGAACPE